ncbi:MAG: trypsin-like peptidase domain-containing protein [Bryobacteraceae bacterium]
MSVQVEYLPASGLREDALPFRITGLSHLWEDLEAVPDAVAARPLALSGKAGSAHPGSTLSLNANTGGREVAACHLDVSCYPEWRKEASGVARILFVENNVVSACSGALINSRSGTGKPLFLTADHCVSSEEVARTVQANFFYETAACGANEPDFNRVENILGASYLDSDDLPAGDYSLLLLSGAPSNVYYFGWTTEEPAMGARVTGIHHPAGTFKRISFGERVKDEGIVVGGVLVAEYAPADKFYAIHKTEGKAQGGSSGSPLLNGNKQIVGILSAGPSYSPIPEEQDRLLCEAPRLVVYYGRLTAGYDALQPWLEDLRAAQMAFPRPGDTLPGSTVNFRWSSGVGAREFRILIGREVGGAEIASRSTGLATSVSVAGLPRDGRPVHVRLMTLLESGWEAVDTTYIAQNGAQVDAASIVSPVAGSVIRTGSVLFQWANGVKVDEYRLEIGTSLGGGDIYGNSAGKATQVTVKDIPLDGTPLHARLWSYIGGEWVKRDYVYARVDARRATNALRIANRLAYPVAILVNERSVASIAAGSTQSVNVPRAEGTTVTWRLIRPMRPDTGAPLGEALTGAIAASSDEPVLDIEISNRIGSDTWFAPTVTNNSGLPQLLEANGTRLFYALGRGETIGLGYYKYSATSSVRGYADVVGYSGSVTILREFEDQIAEGSGAVALELR